MPHPAVLLRNQVKSLSRKHDPVAHEREWLKHVYTTFEISPSSRIAYTRKFRFHNTLIFTIQEYGERMSPRRASELCKLAVKEEHMRDADFGRIYFEQALIDMDGPAMTSKLLVSEAVTDGEIIIPFAADRTIKASFKEFQERVDNIIHVEVIDWAHTQQMELQPLRNSLDVMLRDLSANTEQVNFLFQKTSDEISHIHGQTQSALTFATSTSTKIEEPNRKLGHVNEEIFRQRLNDQEGSPWAKSFRFDTLADIVEWAGLKIQANKNERRIALRHIVEMCIGNFDGFKVGKDVDWTAVYGPSVNDIDLVVVAVRTFILLFGART
jgi:hypothetical protein